MIDTALILAGGLGTRLRSIEPELPKCLVNVHDHAIIDYVISFIQKNGINNIILCLGYKSDLIIEYIKEKYKSRSIMFSVERKPLGTGGAVRKALTKTSSQSILVLNGDTFAPFNVSRFYEKHNSRGANFSIAAVRVEDVSRYGNIKIKNDLVYSFEEKKNLGEGYINSGTYLIEKDFFLKKTKEGTFSIEKFMSDLSRRSELYSFLIESDFIDIGEPNDLKRARKEYKWPTI